MSKKDNKYVVLDFDGTLIDTERVMLESIKQYATIKGVRHDDDFALQFVGVCPADIITILNKEYGDEFESAKFLFGAVKYFNDNLLNNLTPLRNGAKELLDYLKNNGWKIALATTTQGDIVDVELMGHDIKKYFDVIVTGDMVNNNKPSPEIYFKTTSLMGVEPSNCYAVEDSTVGIMSAVNAGMKTLAVPDLHPVRDDLKPKCKGIFNDCFEVINYLKTLSN